MVAGMVVVYRHTSLHVAHMYTHSHVSVCPKSTQLSYIPTHQDSSFTLALGQVDLDLPSAPETAPRPPALTSLAAKFGPVSEISHIFRQPEKRPTSVVSYAFTLISLLPLAGFLAGVRWPWVQSCYEQ